MFSYVSSSLQLLVVEPVTTQKVAKILIIQSNYDACNDHLDTHLDYCVIIWTLEWCHMASLVPHLPGHSP